MFTNAILAAFGLGGMEVVLILAVVLILFGAKKIPELAKGLGSGIKEFKKATKEVTDEIQNSGTPNASTELHIPPSPAPSRADLPAPQTKPTETKVI